MKRILVISDSHGNADYVLAAADAEKPIDCLLHAGDLQGDDKIIEEKLSCPIYMVAGNCDYFTDQPSVRIAEISGSRILLVHGHQFYVSSLGTRLLKEEARKLACNIVVFGHTHRPVIDDENRSLVVLNPGSIACPRQEGRERTYLLLELEEDGRIAGITQRSL